VPRLLIVDDEKDMLDFLERVFRRDYEVVRAHSVDEAERQIANKPVDVVITDRRMPKRGGLELLEILAKANPRTARILLTGYADSLVDEKVAQWRLVDAWVSKPIDSAALKQAVLEAVSKSSSRTTSH
jgi:response regulator RpfG family c-di-GMP phosphodiesterase